MAGDGPTLELAIGTGRIALPPAARGVRVDGIDISPAMIAKLRDKAGGDQISVTIGDFAEVPAPGSYRLVYVVFNTLFNLLSQEEQVRCFENVAAHLTDDGSFVVEAFVPTYLTRLRDPVTQRLSESHVRLTGEGVRLYPIVTRYAWPAELDLMARIAGLRLKDR